MPKSPSSAAPSIPRSLRSNSPRRAAMPSPRAAPSARACSTSPSPLRALRHAHQSRSHDTAGVAELLTLARERRRSWSATTCAFALPRLRDLALRRQDRAPLHPRQWSPRRRPAPVRLPHQRRRSANSAAVRSSNSPRDRLRLVVGGEVESVTAQTRHHRRPRPRRGRLRRPSAPLPQRHPRHHPPRPPPAPPRRLPPHRHHRHTDPRPPRRAADRNTCILRTPLLPRLRAPAASRHHWRRRPARPRSYRAARRDPASGHPAASERSAAKSKDL